MTCKGRLNHVKQSVPRLQNVPLFFVDFFCPEQSGDWVSQFPQATVIKAAELADQPQEHFNKPLALNIGALAACDTKARYLVFLDADTLITPALLDFVHYHASPDRFMIFEPNVEKKDLSGFLVVQSRHFLKVGGFDQNFAGWGAEDLEFRLRLFLRAQAPEGQANLVDLLSWTEIPSELASCIPHSDELRVAQYHEKDKDKSHDLNLNLLCSNLYNWLGVHPLDLHDHPVGASIRRLLGMDLRINPFAMK